jgi:hypothetical protein
MTPACTASADAPAIPIHLALHPEDRLPGWVYPGDYGCPAALLAQVISTWRQLGRYDHEHPGDEEGKALAAIIEAFLSAFPEVGRRS